MYFILTRHPFCFLDEDVLEMQKVAPEYHYEMAGIALKYHKETQVYLIYSKHSPKGKQ